MKEYLSFVLGECYCHNSPCIGFSIKAVGLKEQFTHMAQYLRHMHKFSINYIFYTL